jgi:hypothetical protein
MATHKVPQDVEADDKFLGPLSFKQFLFFGGTAISAYLSFLTLTKIWPISFLFIIPTLAFGVLAIPWSKEQPTELFLASRIRFLIKPRKRIWNQSGVKNLVNITVPVREAHIYSDGLSQGEVRNRLSALATMVDSRGWAIKNITTDDDSSDRLVQVPQALDEKLAVVEATPDLFDESVGTIAKQFDSMIQQSEQQHRSETMKLIEDARRRSSESVALQDSAPLPATPIPSAPNSQTTQNSTQKQDFWFVNAPPNQSLAPGLATFQTSAVVTPGATTSTQPQMTNTTVTDLSEEELLEAVHKKHERDALQTTVRHERIIDPDGLQKPQTLPVQDTSVENTDISTMTPQSNPDILNLAQRNDLNIETISRQANKKKDFDDEVIVSLH